MCEKIRINLIVYGDPVPQPRVCDDTRKQREFGLKYMPKYDPAAKKKENFLLKCIQHRPDEPFTEPLEVNITWFFKRPKSHYGSYKGKPYLREDAPKHHSMKKRCDRDNLDKFVLDALTGKFWIDDGIISKGTLLKLYTDKLPRTEIEIIPL